MGVVHGHVVHPRGTIDAPIGRHPRHRQQMTVLPKVEACRYSLRCDGTIKRIYTCSLSVRDGADTPNSCSYEVYRPPLDRRSPLWPKKGEQSSDPRPSPSCTTPCLCSSTDGREDSSGSRTYRMIYANCYRDYGHRIWNREG